MKQIISLCALLALAQVAHADVYVLESDGLAAKHNTQAVPGQQVAGTPINAHTAKPGEKLHGIPLGGVHPTSAGSQALIDASGFKYFINTNINFNTTSSASGAMSEASYTHAVAATTMNGGNTNFALNDAFDGYGSICVSLTGVLGQCTTSNPSFVFYNQTGAAPTSECNGRQLVYPVQALGGGLSVNRKVYVPSDDSFARWLEVVTNTSAAPITFSLMTSNNLGSDNNTRITATSTGTIPPTIADKWVATFQNYSGTTSSDPRLGHVMQGAGAATPLAGITFADGSDKPWWGYSVTLIPGQTKILMHFVTAQPSKAAAAAQSAKLAALVPTSLECLTPTERSQITNFAAAIPPPAQVPSLSPSALIWLMLGVAMAGAFYTLRRRA